MNDEIGSPASLAVGQKSADQGIVVKKAAHLASTGLHFRNCLCCNVSGGDHGVRNRG